MIFLNANPLPFSFRFIPRFVPILPQVCTILSQVPFILSRFVPVCPNFVPFCTAFQHSPHVKNPCYTFSLSDDLVTPASSCFEEVESHMHARCWLYSAPLEPMGKFVKKRSSFSGRASRPSKVRCI